LLNCAVESLDLTTDTWSDATPMLVSRMYLAAAAYDNRIYAIGGVSVVDGITTTLNSVEALDHVTGRWELMAPMGTARYGMAAAATYNHIYVVGGFDGQSDLASVEDLDLTMGTWTRLVPMSLPRNYLAVTLVGRQLYALGGFNGQAGFLDTMEVLDLSDVSNLSCHNDDVAMRAATSSDTSPQGYSCDQIASGGACPQVARLDYCGCSCPPTSGPSWTAAPIMVSPRKGLVGVVAMTFTHHSM
jgi:hypothetical protein